MSEDDVVRDKVARPANWPIQSFDARDWAQAFHKRFPAVSADDVLGWFAAALMRGYDEHARREEAKYSNAQS